MSLRTRLHAARAAAHRMPGVQYSDTARATLLKELEPDARESLLRSAKAGLGWWAGAYAALAGVALVAGFVVGTPITPAAWRIGGGWLAAIFVAPVMVVAKLHVGRQYLAVIERRLAEVFPRRCPECVYDCGSDVPDRCPECGALLPACPACPDPKPSTIRT